MTVLLAAVLVFVAVMLVPAGPGRRLRRLLPPGAAQQGGGDRSEEGRRCETHAHRLRAVRRRRDRPTQADEAVRAVAELAALLRAGLPAQRVWAYLPSQPLPTSGCSPPGWSGCRQSMGCRSHGISAWELLLREADSASREGRSVAGVLRGRLTECPPEVRSIVHGLAAAWEVSERTGAPSADVLDRLAQGLRAETDARDARSVAMAGPRATARILAWLPFVGLALGQLVGADPVRTLLMTPLGRACGVVGALLAVAAAVWTRRLIDLAARVR